MRDTFGNKPEHRFVKLLATLVLLVLAGFPASRLAHADEPVEVNLPEPIAAGLASSNPDERASAVQAIRLWENPAAVTVLLDQLADPDQKVGLYTAQILGELASPENLPALRVAMRYPNPDVRWRVALVLGEMGDTRAIPTLARALQDPDVLVQRTAADALVQIGGPAAASALIRALDNPQPSIVNAAMNGLLELGDPAVRPLIIALYSNSHQTRLNSATILGYIAAPEARPALKAATSDPDPAVRAEAQWALDQIRKNGQDK
jgi:HEAT repeat protein